ncbi:cell envelope integrity EipB family protein [Breoghania corrubedonensis]|uniref:cell envelope integrity EipB family protein n=1 Tax=Breoghania corrubedonensis TaxID=665038 RepID=UPI00147656BE|nr:cell envelope integrity EipB family protein [Breoghania corrubedonensis]
MRSIQFSRALAGGAVVAITLWGSSFSAAAQKAAVDLAPHRAVYDLKLDDSTDRSGIAGADGRIVYEVNGSRCEGYTSTFRLVMRIFDTKGGSQLTDLQTSSYESAEGFDFTVRTFANGVATENTLGRARHADDAVAVDLKRPEEESLTLKGKALFPVEHTQAIIDTAQAGKNILEADTFDGSESGRAIFPTLTVIGKPIGAEENLPQAGDHKRGEDDAAVVARIGKRAGTAWPVTVSYYAPNTPMEESEPVYEISFIQYANGVTRRLRLDYGDFSVDGGLSALEYEKPAAPCPGE